MTNITCSNSITTVQQNSNLQKTYFNIRGKFYTRDTIFYIFLDTDVYEIPLAKLQVDGSSQATMQDGINALSSILVNAGTSGGGGSVFTDNTTILGDGTNGNPLYATGYVYNDNNISLNFYDYTALEPGVYRVTGAGDGTFRFSLPDAADYVGRTIIVINTDGNPMYFNTTNAPFNPDDSDVYTLPTTSVYTLTSINGHWYITSLYQI
jgi:hypothetical protein